MSRFRISTDAPHVECLYCGEPMMALAKDGSFQLEGLIAAQAAHDCPTYCPHCNRQL